MNQVAQVQTWMPHRYSQDDRIRIRHTFCEECSDAEADQFIATCERTGLDPWARQIYPRMQWNTQKGCKVMTVGITIDGQRLIAKRTGQYQGQTKPEWCGKDGVWKEIWLASEAPAGCRVGVHCTGFVEPIYGIALYSDYAQKTREGKITQMWRDKSAHMLWKCAEALGLRKAFPQELSGLYTDDEMMQTERADEQPARQLPPARQAQSSRPMPTIAPNPMRAIAPPEQPPLETNGTRHDGDGVVVEEEPETQDDLDAKRADAYIKVWMFVIQNMTPENRVDSVNKWNKEGKPGCAEHGLTKEEHDNLQKLVIAKNKMLKEEEANRRVQA